MAYSPITNPFFQRYLQGQQGNPLLVTPQQNQPLGTTFAPVGTTLGQGGTQGGAGGAGGNPNGGLAGSAGTGTAKGVADALMGLAMGFMGPAGMAMAALGQNQAATADPSTPHSIAGFLANVLGLSGPSVSASDPGLFGPQGALSSAQTSSVEGATSPAALAATSGLSTAPSGAAATSASPDNTTGLAASEQGATSGFAGFSGSGTGVDSTGGSSSVGSGALGAAAGTAGGFGATGATGDTGQGGTGGGGEGGDGGGGGDACFAGDTQITMGDGSKKAIRDIRPGDEVLAFSAYTTSPKKVLEITANGLSRKAIRLNGTIVTGEHPFLNLNGGWWIARLLTPGDEVVGEQGLPVKIESVDLDAGLHEVYNFEVEDFHTYIADGFRVHNSKAKGGRIPGPAPKDPTKDNVTTTAQGGEYMLPRHAVSLIGMKNLEEIRNIANSAAPDHMKHAGIHAVLKRIQNAGTIVRRAPGQ